MEVREQPCQQLGAATWCSNLVTMARRGSKRRKSSGRSQQILKQEKQARKLYTLITEQEHADATLVYEAISKNGTSFIRYNVYSKARTFEHYLQLQKEFSEEHNKENLAKADFIYDYARGHLRVVVGGQTYGGDVGGGAVGGGENVDGETENVVGPEDVVGPENVGGGENVVDGETENVDGETEKVDGETENVVGDENGGGGGDVGGGENGGGGGDGGGDGGGENGVGVTTTIEEEEEDEEEKEDPLTPIPLTPIPSTTTPSTTIPTSENGELRLQILWGTPTGDRMVRRDYDCTLIWKTDSELGVKDLPKSKEFVMVVKLNSRNDLSEFQIDATWNASDSKYVIGDYKSDSEDFPWFTLSANEYKDQTPLSSTRKRKQRDLGCFVQNGRW